MLGGSRRLRLRRSILIAGEPVHAPDDDGVEGRVEAAHGDERTLIELAYLLGS